MFEEITEIISRIEQPLITGEIEDINGYKLLSGDMKIIFTAPHSVDHFRNNKVKIGEYRTGVIATILNQKTNCFAMFKTMNFNDDANFDEENYFKKKLEEVIRQNDIKFLIDLHIMSPTRDFNVDIGTGNGKNVSDDFCLVELIKQNLNFDDVMVDHVFDASYEHTVCSYISRTCGIPCVQLEFNWKSLEDLKSFEDVINSLENIVRGINESM